MAFPANIYLIFSMFLDLSNFSFFQTEKVEKTFFTFTDTEAIDPNFEALDIFWKKYNAIIIFDFL